jgi:hypothetical protein
MLWRMLEDMAFDGCETAMMMRVKMVQDDSERVKTRLALKMRHITMTSPASAAVSDT